MSNTSTPSSRRLESIDLLRGIVIALMALDHVRSSFGPPISPVDLDATTPALFATRWITHLCAPTFVLLAGVSAALFASRKGASSTTRFLWTRGLWLIILELTVIRSGWMLAVTPLVFSLMVISTLGACMVALAVLIKIPRAWLTGLSLLMIVGHNLLDGVTAGDFGSWAPLWSIAHEYGAHEFGPITIRVVYPLVPWIGVMALGWCIAPVLRWPVAKRRQACAVFGIGALIAASVLRFVHAYGDPNPWDSSGDSVRDLLSFFNVTKYPPSLQFLLATLGVAALLWVVCDWWAACERVGLLRRAIVCFGRVPLFFYVLHLYVIHVAAMVTLWAIGAPEGTWRVGLSVPSIYLVWIAVLLAMWPPCAWMMRAKKRSNKWWMSYL